ncbi:hypothetical protein FRC00_009808 [Tulasnella sp. 408]|nr:hypothetical protein FRC00_009808 [Tulasnella sp. 408]
MFGLSLPGAKAPKTRSTSVTGQNEPRQKHSPVAKSLKKLKQVVSFGRSNKNVSSKNESSSHNKYAAGCHLPAVSKPTVATEKPLPPPPLAPTEPATRPRPRHPPRTPSVIAPSAPITKTALKKSRYRSLLSNPSDLDRYLDQYPRPKIVYTAAEAKTVVEAFIENAKYEEDLARNHDFSHHKLPKPREERPPSWDRSFEAQIASARYSATSEDIRRMKEVPIHEAWQDVTGQVGSSSSKPELGLAEPCSITTEEMEMIIQDPNKLDTVWNKAELGSGSCEHKSAATSRRVPTTTDDLEAVAQGPVDIDWEGASQFESWYWEFQNMRPWTWSFIAGEMDQPDVERQEAARNQAYLKLVQMNLCDEYPRVF